MLMWYERAARAAAGPGARLGAAAFLAGAGAALGHPPFAALWAALPALWLLFVLFGRAATPRAAALLLWAGGFGYFALALSWIVQPFFVDPWRHGWMAPFAILLLSGGLALFWGAAGALAFWLGRSAAGRSLALVLILTGAELLRGYVFTGFPWAMLGHIFIGWPQMQLAAFAGPGGLTLLALAVAALAAIRAPRRWSGPSLALLVLGLATGAGLWRGAQLLPPGPGQVVRLVQPAIPQSLKWDAEAAGRHFEGLLELTAAAPGPLGAPALTLWPETSFPWYLDGGEPLLATARAASQPGALVIGAMRTEPEPEPGADTGGWRVMNSVAEIGEDGAPLQLYDKHHLVPFGEYVPLAGVLGALGLQAMVEQGGFTAGPGPALMDAGPLGRFLPLICYEAIFPQDIRHAPARPDWLLQVTNDAWFGTFSGPYQHLAQARLRAVETGLPMVRVANTGVSAVIDAHGRVLAGLGLGLRGHLDAELPGALPATLYWRYGDLPLVLMLLALTGALALRRKGRTIVD